MISRAMLPEDLKADLHVVLLKSMPVEPMESLEEDQKIPSTQKLNHKQTHGHNVGNKTTQVYRAFHNMNTRCYNKNVPRYKNYGGRGIQVCPEWRKPYGFQTFLQDMGEPPSKNHSLDRIDNSLGYSKDNCRWATMIEQIRNSRHVNLVTINQETLPLNVWSLKLGFGGSTLSSRLHQAKKKNKEITATQIVEAAYLEHQKKYGTITNN